MRAALWLRYVAGKIPDRRDRILRLVPAGVVGLCGGLVLLASGGLLSQELGLQTAAAATGETIQGTLADGSNYRVVMPEAWNGTLVLDLDFANNLEAPPRAVEQWMTANGFAIGGISREPVAYRFRQAVDDLLDVRVRFADQWGTDPTRTLTMNNFF